MVAHCKVRGRLVAQRVIFVNRPWNTAENIYVVNIFEDMPRKLLIKIASKL